MARFSGSTYSAAVDEAKRLIALATLGNTQVDMSNYYSKTDSDNKFAAKADLDTLKTDSDNKFAAKADLDTLTTSLDDLKTVHGTHVADSVAHLTQDERDKILTTDDIATSISTNPSNDKVASEKFVNDLLQTEGSGNLTIPLNEDLNNLTYSRTRVWMNSQTDQIATFTNMPSGKYTECAIIYIPYENTSSYFGEQIFVGNTNSIFIRNKYHEEWTAWRRVCTTSVADVPVIKLTVTGWASGNVYYCVKNGICYVHVSSLLSTTMSTYGQVIANGLPKPIMPGEWHTISAGLTTGGTLLVQILDNGAMCNYIGSNEVSYFGSFSYPVAE